MKNLRYHYSFWGTVVLLVLGLVFLFFSLDAYIFHKVITERLQPPPFVIGIAFLFTFLCLSSFIMNLIKGKNYVIDVNENEVRIYTACIGGGVPEIIVDKSNLRCVEVKRARDVFSHGSKGGSVLVLIFQVAKNTVNWPKVMIMKNRIKFNRRDGYDEIVVDGFLNKSKKVIKQEIESFYGLS